MFLWCGCHCNPEAPSELFPSSYGGSVQGGSASQSVDSAGPPQVPVVDCIPCRFGIAPAVLEFEWNYTGKAENVSPLPQLQNPCCSSYSTQKKYRLHKRPPQPFEFTVCRWTSNEVSRAEVNVPQPFPLFPKRECIDTREPRVMLELSRTNPEGGVSGLLRVFFQYTVHQAIYWMVDDAGNQIFTRPEGIDCLRILRFRGAWALGNTPKIWLGSGWDRNGFPYGSPCDQAFFSAIDPGLPEYVTCTPVAA